MKIQVLKIDPSHGALWGDHLCLLAPELLDPGNCQTVQYPLPEHEEQRRPVTPTVPLPLQLEHTSASMTFLFPQVEQVEKRLPSPLQVGHLTFFFAIVITPLMAVCLGYLGFAKRIDFERGNIQKLKFSDQHRYLLLQVAPTGRRMNQRPSAPSLSQGYMYKPRTPNNKDAAYIFHRVISTPVKVQTKSK
jgi:hypothetical protein